MGKINERIKEAEKHGIFISDTLRDRLKVKDDIRGIYGIFSRKNDEETCLYIGRAYSIVDRCFSYNGHITEYMHNNDEDGKLISKLINNSRKKNHIILIELIEEVEFQGDNYNRDMQRLVYAEYKNIEEYQEKGQCLNQLPEGNWIEKDKWEELHKKQ